MIASRGLTLIELDKRASEADKPYGLITADCSAPHEIDDGISVEALPTAHEMYRVRVFAVDTSKHYRDNAVITRALQKVESHYYDTETGLHAYEPMLDPGLTQRLHFARGVGKSALVVTFIIGAEQPPVDIDVNFGAVEIIRNYNYKTFGEKCRYSDRFWPYGRAAALLMHHLGVLEGSDEEIHRGFIHVPRDETWQRGAMINQSFMVAANHLVARLMREEDRLAIYRVHDLSDETYTEFLGPGTARYSKRPGPHDGLGLDGYTRVTSPLRRLEDFVMHGLLKERSRGQAPDTRDQKLVSEAIRRLNQRVGEQQLHDKPDISGQRQSSYRRRLLKEAV